LLGFGLPGIVIALAAGTEGAAQYLLVVLYSSLLGLVFTGLAVLISLAARRRQIALGIALAVWVFYELVYGVLMLASTLYLPASMVKQVLLVGLMGNPIDVARVLSLLQVGGPHLFGPAGASLVGMTGSAAVATSIGLAGLLIWIVTPLAVSTTIFKRQNL
jgi:Cu-processing system permease protein